MNSEQPTYYQPLTLEKINEVVEEIEKYHSEEEKRFNAWYKATCKTNPNFRQIVENAICEEFKKWTNKEIDFEITEKQIKSYLKNKLRESIWKTNT